MGVMPRRVTWLCQWRMRRIGTHSVYVALVCHGYRWILLNSRYSCLPEMWIFVGRVLHTGTDITLEMRYLGCFWISFCPGEMVKNRRQSSAGATAWGLRYLWIMRDFAYSWITEHFILVRGSWCRETQITPKPSFSSFFAFVLHGPRNVTWRGLERTRRIVAHYGQVALVCHGNVLSCP